MEEVLPPQTEQGGGFEIPRVRQFTVFLENRVGRLQMLLRAIETRVGPIVGLMLEESADAALARLICAEPDLCREALKAEGFCCRETDILAVELPRRTRQPLVSLCTALLAAEINIHYAYPLLHRPRGASALAIYVDDGTLAAQLLIKKGFTVLGESDLRR